VKPELFSSGNIDFRGYTPADSGAKSIGVMDIRGLTDDMVIAVVFSNNGSAETGTISTVLVGVQSYGGDYMIVPLPLRVYDSHRIGDTDEPVLFRVPHQGAVIHDGVVLMPRSEGNNDSDVYEMSGINGNTHESIEVFLGTHIGTLHGWVISDMGVIRARSNGSTGYGAATIGITNDIAALAVTRQEFRGVHDEIEHRTQFLTQRISELLDDNDTGGFLELTRHPDRFVGNNGGIAPQYSGYFKLWEGQESIHGARNTVTVNTMEIIRLDTVRVTYSVLKTLPSGNQYVAEGCQILLRYTDGDWYIENMSRDLFSYRENVWKKV
jgi:hypothetical protein